MNEPFSDEIPAFLERHEPITRPQNNRAFWNLKIDPPSWWRRVLIRRIRANFRWLFNRRHTSATLIINVRWDL